MQHPIFARCYGRLSTAMEPRFGPYRRQQLAGLAGEVVEVGAGNGMNFRHYPAAVARLVAVEPEPHLRALARVAAARAPVPVQIVDGLAEHLPLPDASFDAAVSTLVLCSVSDPAAALAEIRRVLRPGGRLHFLEHVGAESPGLRRVQRVLDATLWPRLAGGCHLQRDTAAAIRAAGFTVTELVPVRIPDLAVPVPTSPHILGTAVR